MVLLPALDLKKAEIAETTLPSGMKINFYQLYPLYQEELDYKFEHGYDAFLDLLTDDKFPLVVDPARASLLEDIGEVPAGASGEASGEPSDEGIGEGPASAPDDGADTSADAETAAEE